MQIERWILGALVAAVLMSGVGTREARACGGGYLSGTDVLIGMGALAAAAGDVAFTFGDTALALKGQPPPLAWGVGELLLAAPQAALYGYWTSNILESNQNQFNERDATFPMVMTLWTAALAAHGVYVIARSGRHPAMEDPPRHASADWRVAPAMVSAGPSQTAPGAVVFGRF